MRKITQNKVIQKSLLIGLSSTFTLLSGCSLVQKSPEVVPNNSIEKQSIEPNTSSPEIFLAQIDHLPDDFILGADVSSLIAQENSGVIYYDEQGNPADLIATLARNNINTIRVRVWNDPYDSNHNGYGGGNNDINTAIAIGKRATAYNLSLMVDFHYSDFWADPAKQMCPKDWIDLTAEEKEEAAYQFTYDSLKKLLDEGINVSIVQIGNETTNGLSGETKWSSMKFIFDGGSRAIQKINEEYGTDILTAVHFTNPETPENYKRYAQMLHKFQIQYDVFASSYYPYWHGTLTNLTDILTQIAETYDKSVMVSEFSYAYTFDDGDNFGNTISDSSVCELPYSISVQGQTDCIHDVAMAVNDCNGHGIGICYWEPAWIPVPGSDFESRSMIWEQYGSGWASSYASEYDPEDAGKYYGGSSWDNQALFDFNGYPLASLSAFRFLHTGATTDLKIDFIPTTLVKLRIGQDMQLPSTVLAHMNDGTEIEVPVTWSTALSDIDQTIAGSYSITGTSTYEGVTYPVDCTLSIVEPNYVENESFEEPDLSMWSIYNYDNVTSEIFVSEKSVDAVDGSKSMHYYSTNAVNFSMEQEIQNLPDGIYSYSMAIHGGDCNNQEMEIYAIADGVTYTAPCQVTSWQEVTYPSITDISSSSGTITIGIRIKCDALGWGNLDCFQLTKKE